MRTHRKTTRLTHTLLEEFQATLNGAPFTHKAYAAWLENRCQHQRDQIRITDDLLRQATNRANNTENILGARLEEAGLEIARLKVALRPLASAHVEQLLTSYPMEEHVYGIGSEHILAARAALSIVTETIA